MIFPRNCYFYCDTEAEVKELLQMLEYDGMRWASGDQLTRKPLRHSNRTLVAPQELIEIDSLADLV